MENIRSEIRTARKNYYCDACHWVREVPRDVLNDTLTFSEKRAYIRAKQAGFRIKKGDKYLYQFNIV